MRTRILRCIAVVATTLAASTISFAGKYTGGVSINVDQNVNFNFNIASQGNRTATVWYSNKMAIAIEGASASTYDRATMEKIVSLMQESKASFEDITGLRNLPLNGGYKRIPTIQVPRDNNGAGGLASHGIFGLSVGKGLFDPFYNRVKSGNISVDQVWLYEMNRNFFKSGSNGWNAWIDWSMTSGASDYGFWTVGFNNASAFWIVDDMGVGLHYFGKDYKQFRADHKKDYDKYLSTSNYNFNNTWASKNIPWRSGTVNTLMSATLLEWYDNFGGTAFIKRLYQQLDNNPRLRNRTDYQTARDNWYRAASRAANKNLIDYFENTLKWPISSAAESTIAKELGNGGGGNGGGNGSSVSIEAESGELFGAFKSANSSSASGGKYLTTTDNQEYWDETHTENRVELTVKIEEAGRYQFKGTIAAEEGDDDSFWLNMNDGTMHLWDTIVSNSFVEVDGNSRGVSETLYFDLAAGTHCLKVYPREDGGKLDKVRLIHAGESSSPKAGKNCSGGGGDNGGGDNGGGDNGGGDNGNYVGVTGVSLPENLGIKPGVTGALVATVSPANATNKTLTWKSANTSIATVDSRGNVTAIASGTTQITVVSEDGNYTASTTVVVTNDTPGGGDFETGSLPFFLLPLLSLFAIRRRS